MESTNLDTSPSSALPDSAIFGDIDKLSPITAVKDSHAVTDFSGLSSPIAFESPNLNPSPGSYSKRFHFHPLSSEGICQLDSEEKKKEYDSKDTAKNTFRSSRSLIRCTQKVCDNGSRENQFSRRSLCFDKYLVDAVKVGYEKTKHSASYDLIQSKHCPELESKFASLDNVRKNSEEALAAFPDILPLGEQQSHKDPYFNEKLVEKDANDECNELLSRSKGLRGRGLHGRRLQFEEADRSIIENTSGSCKPLYSESTIRSPCPGNLKVLDPLVSERTATPGSGHLANSNQPISMISFTRGSKSRVSKPLRIGLHLNDIISSKPDCVNTGESITSDEKVCLDDVQEEKLVPCSGYNPQGNTYNSSVSLEIGEIFSTTRQHEEASNSYCLEFSSSIDLTRSMQRDYQATQCGKRKSTFEQACEFEELSQFLPKKKSKKALASSDGGGGCKRCNCKKTKCLKLYCDCFAAGIYCSANCFCQGCFNRPDYIDTILEVRKQIESRNPLAFTPKIAERLIDSHVDNNRTGGTNSTPSSARHKRGCNCKKSMCMKKYCECFLNNVGCSSGCRCEGCQNIYGKKEDYFKVEEAVGIPIPRTCNENVQMLPNQDCLLQNEPSDLRSITPITPSFQLLNNGMDGLKSNFSSRRYPPSPESDLRSIPNCPGSPGISDNHSVPVKSNKNGVNSSLREFDCGDDSTADVFSSTYNRLNDAVDSSRQQKSQDQLSFGSADLSSVSSLEKTRSSCITPVCAKVLKAEVEEKRDNILEDDTPERLKDPINSVKVLSPNKKRISPPHICGLRRLGPSFSSAGLKSGCKFILRALPHFTPCIDDKETIREKDSRDL